MQPRCFEQMILAGRVLGHRFRSHPVAQVSPTLAPIEGHGLGRVFFAVAEPLRLIPPWAAPEWLRTGCILETIATSAPKLAASTAARMPASPPPITTMSCLINVPSFASSCRW